MSDDDGEWLICAGVEKCEGRYGSSDGCKRHIKVHRRHPECDKYCMNDAVCRQATDAEIVMARMLGEI
jgi:hypothetical protein